MRRYKVGDHVSHHPNNGKNRTGNVTAINNDDDKYFTYQIRFDDGSGRQWVHPKNMNLIDSTQSKSSILTLIPKP
jgi:hypothetical protein